MRKNFKVTEVSIPKIKEQYLTDFRNVRFEANEDEYWSIECWMDTRAEYDKSVSILLAPTKTTSAEEVFNEFKKGGFYNNYLCVSVFDDGNGYNVYEFYREALKDDHNKVIKPYSTITGRTSEKFIVGEIYTLCYKPVE